MILGVSFIYNSAVRVTSSPFPPGLRRRKDFPVFQSVLDCSVQPFSGNSSRRATAINAYLLASNTVDLQIVRQGCLF